MGLRTAKEIEVVKLRTRSLITALMERIGCANPHQFGAWINRESERLGWPDTQSSNKWYHLLDGKLKKHPVEVVSMLSQLFPDAEQLYHDGPAGLWRALWGDARDPSVLWPLCRTRFSNFGPWFDAPDWKEIEADFLNERTFGETLREFEGELLFAMAHGESLTLNHLTEAISLYRLHQVTNCLAVSDIDGVGAYRCIRHCLDDIEIWSQLNSYDGFYFVRDELVDMEIGRLTSERSYLESVGIQKHHAMLYADDPLPWIDSDVRWSTLNLDGAPVSRRIPEVSGSELLRSTRGAKLTLVPSLQVKDLATCTQ
jgi:hypothetical protein